MESCIDTLLFGEICDKCDGGAIFKVVAFFTKVVSAGVLVLAVIGIIICGIMILTAGSDAGKLARAKKRIVEIVIGIVVYALMFTIVNFIIPGGIVESTLDSSTSSCPKVDPLPDPNKSNGGGDDDNQGNDEPNKPKGQYPFAHVQGKESEGSIVCPRNANYTYEGPAGATPTKKDVMYQSVAHSCPFSEVTYTDNDQDELCATGGTMHYVADKKWCIVNTKIDVFQYQKYLIDNHIDQDGRTCTTDGSNCVKGDKNKVKETWNMSDFGACNYFANVIASNLNNGEVVSNDAYMAQYGFGWWDGYNQMTKFGNTKVSWRGTYYAYDDNLIGKANAGHTSEAFGGSSNLDWILGELRKGKAVPIATRSGNPGGGHYMTAVGYQAEQCAKKTKDGAYGKCAGWALIVLNTTTSIYNMGKIGYCLGYSSQPCR